MKKIAAFILFIGVLDSISAQSTLTLDSCRALALSNLSSTYKCNFLGADNKQ